jgi:hypothetical protein
VVRLTAEGFTDGRANVPDGVAGPVGHVVAVGARIAGLDPMSAFARQIGVSCRPANPLPELTGFDCAEGRRLSAAEVAASLSLQYEAFPEAVGPLRAGLGPQASVAEGIEAFVTRAGPALGPSRCCSSRSSTAPPAASSTAGRAAACCSPGSTPRARMAYADGAMTSGIRGQKRLLGRPSVHLGPVSSTRGRDGRQTDRPAQ